jgi:hypothetical protein
MLYVARLPIEIPKKINKMFCSIQTSIRNLISSIAKSTTLGSRQKKKLQTSTFKTIKLLIYNFITDNVNSFHKTVERLTNKLFQGIEEATKAIPGVGSVVAIIRVGDTIVTSVTEFMDSIAATLNGFAKGIRRDHKTEKLIDEKMDSITSSSSSSPTKKLTPQ